MVNKTLTNQCESDVSFFWKISVLTLLFVKIPIPFKNFFFNRLCFHRNHIPLTSWIVLLITFGKVMKIMCTQINFTQCIKFFNNLSLLFLRRNFTSFEIFILLKDVKWNYVVINSCEGIMSHVETFCNSHDWKDSNIDWKLLVEIVSQFVKINISLTLFGCEFLCDLKFYWDSITKCVYSFVCSGSSWPAYSFQLVLISF